MDDFRDLPNQQVIPQDQLGMNDDMFNNYIENNLALLRDLYDSKTQTFLRYETLDQMKKFIIDGKDIILSNLSASGDYTLFIKNSELLLILLDMQKQNYYDDESKKMKQGLFSAIEFTFGRILLILLSSRAKGKDRDRILVSNPQHAFNLALKQNEDVKGNFFTNMFGGKKKPEQGYY